MGKVWSFSRWPLAAVLGLALLLVVALRGDTGSPVEATTFAPTSTFTLSSTGVGTNPTLGFTTVIPPGPFTAPATRDAFFAQFFNFVPTAITLKADTGAPYGGTTGGAAFFIRLGLGNGQCTFLFGGSVTLREATTSRASLVPFTTGFVDSDFDGLEEAVDNYPLFVSQSVPPGETNRFWGHVLVGPQPVDVHFLVYAPGAFGLDPALGQPTLIRTATGDLGAATPSATTDTCAGFLATVTLLGTSFPNPNTGLGGGNALVTLPATGQSVVFALLGQSLRDADNDAIDSGDDTCPYNPNVGSPYTGVDAGDAGETAFIGFPIPFGDKIDAACDADPLSSCGPGPADDFNLSPVGVDCDLDGFPNRQDNCPQVFNPTQLNSEEGSLAPLAADGGGHDDSAGDACDPNDFIENGHFHNKLVIQSKCVTDGLGSVDTDGDGYCDADEAGLGSSSTSAASRPENLLVASTCDDGADNDGDAATDIADTGCQAGSGSHDIQVKKFVGADTASPGQTDLAYVLQLRNKSGVAETATIGISVTATASGCWPMTAKISGGTEVNAVGGGDGTLGTVTLGASTTATTSVPIKVFIDGSCPAAPVGTALYTVAIDVCHGADPAPLGLFGSAHCPGTSDGDQDRTAPLGGNDAPIAITVTQAP